MSQCPKHQHSPPPLAAAGRARSMLAAGKTLKEIAEDLILSEKTITTYRARILEKMGLRNNVELSHYAIKHDLLD